MSASFVDVLVFDTGVLDGETRVNTLEIWALEFLDKMLEPQSLVQRWTWTVWGERARVAYLLTADLLCIPSVISLALVVREGKVGDVIYRRCNIFSVEQFSEALSPSYSGPFRQALDLFAV